MSKSHAKFSPSSLKTFDLCPHFQPFPEDEDKPHDLANEGTMLHDLTERCITLMGQYRAQHGALPAWEHMHLIFAGNDWCSGDLETVDEQKGIIHNSVKEAHTCLSRLTNCEVYLEEKIDAYGITFGTADLILVKGPSAILRDWKFGKRKVGPARCNLQLYAYVLGVFNKFPDVIHIDAGIFQPRISDEVEEPFMFNRAQLPFLVDRVSRIVTRAQMASRGELEGGYAISDACEFCSMIGECPRFSKFLGDTLDASEDELVQELEFPDGLETDEDRGQSMEVVQLIEKWCKNTREMYYTLAQDGLEFDGFAAIHKKGVTTIPEEKRIEAFEGVLDVMMGLDICEKMRNTMGSKTFEKLAKSVSFTLGKVPVEAAEVLAKLAKTGKDSFYLKRKE